MLLKELLEKADKIDELTIEQSSSNKDIWNYEIGGNNRDVRKHLINIVGKIELDDMYKIPRSHRWISKETVDNMLNIIQNATTYEELKCLENFSEFYDCKVHKDEDVATHIGIKVRDRSYRENIRDLFISKINEIDGCKAWYTSWWNLYISSNKIDDRENCKHSCRTQFKINEINKVFEL